MMGEFMTQLGKFSIDYSALLNKVIFLVGVLFVCWLVSWAIKKILHKSQNKFDKFDPIFLPVLTKSITLIVYSLGIVVIFDHFGVNTNSMIALLGAAGLAVALALKDTLQNIAAGTMLLLLRPFSIGDYIECGSTTGTIKEVNIFTTILKTPDGLYVSAPNSSLWGSPIKNYTRNETRRIDVVVGISYGDSIDTGLAVLQDIITSEVRFLADPAPQVMVIALADSSVNLQLRAWASTADYWDLNWSLKRLIKVKIEEAGLTIPFPQTDVHLIGNTP